MVKRLLIGFCFAYFPTSALVAEPLYQTQGTLHSTDTLSPALQQALYDAKKQYHDSLAQISESALLEAHMKQEAAKEKISIEELEKKVFAVSSISEAEAKKWFEANQFRLGGRPFDSIKSEIMQFLTMEQQQKKREALITKEKERTHFSLAIAAPVPPKMHIDTAHFPSKGPATAKLVLTEFADYQCPHCKIASQALKKSVEAHKDQVKFVFLDYPLNTHPVSNLIAEGAACAEAQGKFWDYHYMAFEHQNELAESSPASFATTLKLDSAAFSACMKDPATKEKVARAKKQGDQLGINGTPTLYINGVKYTQAYTEEALKVAIEGALKSPL